MSLEREQRMLEFDLTQLLGWMSTLCFAFCGVPLAIDSFKKGHTGGISRAFLWLWIGGEVFGLYYSAMLKQLPLFANYGFNMLLIIIVIKYTYWPRRNPNADFSRNLRRLK